MKTKIPLNYNTDTTPLGEPCQQAQTLRSGKITNGAMNSGPVRFSNGLTGARSPATGHTLRYGTILDGLMGLRQISGSGRFSP